MLHLRSEKSDNIRSQIEYYFGDINLNKNCYLKSLIKLDGGWVPVDDVMRFKRLRKLTNDHREVFQAIHDQSELVEISEDGKLIRRRLAKPVPTRDELIKELKKRSVAISGFPLTTSVDEVLHHLESFGGKDLRLVMRRHGGCKNFCGSVFVIFNDEESAARYLNDGRENDIYNGRKLVRYMPTEFEEYMKQYIESREQFVDNAKGVGKCY